MGTTSKVWGRYNSQQTAHNQCHRLHGFICTFIGILVSNLIIAYALLIRVLISPLYKNSLDFKLTMRTVKLRIEAPGFYQYK